MEGRVTFAISHNIPQIKDKLLRLRKLVGESPNWQDDMVTVAEKAVRDLKQLTPRSKGGVKGKVIKVGFMNIWQEGKHIADGWKTRHIGKSGKDRVPVVTAIWNNFTHKWTKDGLTPKSNAKLRTAKGMTKKYTLLEVLEYGSPPHTIEPVGKFKTTTVGFISVRKHVKGGKYLKFNVGGETVFTKLVHHPGTRPYGMIRITRAKTIARLALYGRKWLRKIENEWKRG